MSAQNKLTVAVLFGGRSTEHEISVITGNEVLQAIDSSRYAAIPVYIDQRGRWFTGSELLDKAFYKTVPAGLDALTEVTLLPVPRTGGLTVVSNKKGFSLFGRKSEVIPVDVFLPAFHGQFGEDGCIQGLFEMADVPYTGCRVLSSALSMNKQLCKVVLAGHQIPVLPGIVVSKAAAQKSLAKVREEILSAPGLGQFPLFVKPVHLGSSVGVSPAADAPALDAALAKAFQYDTEAIIEPCLTEKLEVNVSVRDCPDPQASVTETPVSTGEVLSYEDKYLRGGGKKGKGGGAAAQGMASLVRVVDPPNLDSKIKGDVIRYALEAYRILDCTGVVRFDFMIDTKSDRLYFNELNPLPGSLAHYLWDKSRPPVLYPELLHEMIQRALARHEQAAGLQKDFGFRALLR